MFQVATILSHHVNFFPATITFYGLATSVALQRVTSDSHWPSDVFIAAVFGTAVSRAVIRLHEERKLQAVPMINPQENALGVRVIHRF
ncbi:MAG: phosphatase PAP2 family protein [candidate division Zixibacteria bacterium]|nr:phosphatase PAP2 family protein [candidate division Zixibacteria bacterium]